MKYIREAPIETTIDGTVKSHVQLVSKPITKNRIIPFMCEMSCKSTLLKFAVIEFYAIENPLLKTRAGA